MQENISSFGGDLDNVTLVGISAGAMSVGFHINSDIPKGLFHKVICQSGSSVSSGNFNLH